MDVLVTCKYGKDPIKPVFRYTSVTRATPLVWRGLTEHRREHPSSYCDEAGDYACFEWNHQWILKESFYK